MSNIENLEKNKVKVTMSITFDEFESAIQTVYNKTKGKYNLQGFRKGKVPRKVIENYYGKQVFYEDAINEVLPKAYDNAIKENDLEVVSRPEIDVDEINEGQDINMYATVYVKPEVIINDYMDIEIEKVEREVSEEDIIAEIDKEREKNSRVITITDRAIEDGDIAVINFEGFVDGEAFEGGKAENYELNIGSKTFIDTFEEQLIGKSIDDEFDVNVTFPENYGDEKLKGKPATFKVKINEIKFKELPELNDEFAEEVSEFETLAEYKESVKSKLTTSKEENAVREKENKVIEALVNKSEIDLPQPMIDSRVDQMINEFAGQIKQQGLEINDYLNFVGQTMDSMKAAYAVDAEKQVRGRLVLQAISEKMDLDITDEEVDAEIARIGENYKMEVELLKSTMSEDDVEGLKGDLKVKKALESVVTAAKEV